MNKSLDSNSGERFVHTAMKQLFHNNAEIVSCTINDVWNLEVKFINLQLRLCVDIQIDVLFDLICLILLLTFLFERYLLDV